jgi:acetate kinase
VELAARVSELRVLAVNAGSTSLKLSLVDAGGEAVQYDDLGAALAGPAPDVVVHRVVHGGDRHEAALVDDALVAELEGLTELAPLHQPPALRAMRDVREALPGVPHVACFDTAFHRTIPAAASTYALPARLRKRVRVYGFHGLSHAWAAGQAKLLAPHGKRVLVAHLGGGASLCAVLDGRSIDTTMGFTPMDGLVMASRSGRIDPGAVLWLAKHTSEDVEQVLVHESGLKGLAGTKDMREVLQRSESGDEAATLALDVYLHRFAAEAAAMIAALGGLDVLVLTGGVGEAFGRIHDLLLQRLAWLGVRSRQPGERSGDSATDRDLTDDGSTARVLVVHAREDLQMAAEASRALGRGAQAPAL